MTGRSDETARGASASGPGRELHGLAAHQSLLWLDEQQYPEARYHHLVATVELSGALDVERLSAAWSATVAAHDALRMVIDRHDARQHRGASPRADLPVVEVPADALDPWIAARSVAPLLGERPPWDAALLRVSPDRHVLYCCVHRIVADEPSCMRLVEELAARYRGDVPDSSASFQEYLEAELEYRRSAEGDADRAYWTRKLGVSAPPLRPYGLVRTDRSAALVRERRSGGADRAHRLAAVAGAPAFRTDGARLSRLAVLATAVAAYLYRVSGDREVLLGVPLPNRSRRFASTCGLLAEQVFVRIGIEEGDTFESLGRRTTAELLETVRHDRCCVSDRDLPYVKLTLLPPLRAPFQGLDAAVRIQPATALAGSALGMGDLRDTLGLRVVDFAEAPLELEFDFHAGTFDSTARRRAQTHFLRILDALAGDLAARIDAAGLVDEEERTAILAAARGADPGGTPPDVVDCIAAQAASRADQIAVVGPDASLTYAQLERSSNALARRLVDLGVRRESRVGVAVPRGAGELVALLATLKAGGAYVPVDPAHPLERVRVILEDAAPEVLVAPSGSPLRSAVPPATRLLPLDDLASATAAYDDAPLALEASPDQIAYILFTSGSTGRPKGVEVLRGALANFLRSMAHTPGLDDSDRLLAITTTTFDIAGLELFLPLWVGAQVVIADRETAGDPGLLRARLEADAGAITCMQATPATWRLLVDAGWTGDGRLRMLCGGEALSPELAAKLLDRGGELWNVYGPTETTIWSTIDRVERAGPITIGRPIDRTTVYVLDPALALVPVGVTGEIYIGGDGLARGYRGRPDLTVERFLPDPHGAPGEGIYRTGDLGRLLPDGRFECLGRLDHQVKIRGFRIELGEIESTLRGTPGVKDAVVVADKSAGAEPRLVAYVVGEADRAALLETARTHLPTYMVPSAFVRLDAFPLTTSGKVDRKALPRPEAPAGARSRADAMAAAPGLDVGADAPSEPAPRAPSADGAVSAPSSIQRQFWLLQQLSEATRAYHIPCVFRIRGALDVAALEGAFRDLVARHAALRTTFSEGDGGIQQVVHRSGELEFRSVEGPVHPEGSEVAAEIQRPFDLGRGPLLRVCLWRNAPDEHVLAWTMHHAVTDLATKSILTRELSERYATRRTGAAAPAVPAPAESQYTAFAEWERRWLESDSARAAEEYFAAHVAPLPSPLALAEDRPRPPIQSPRGARIAFELEPELAARLQRACDAWQVKPFLVLFTAYALLLARYGGTDRVVVGVPFTNRRREAVQGTVGCFVNTLPVVVDRGGNPTFLELLRRARASFLGHHRSQELPLERIIARCRPPRDPSRNAVYQAGFTFEPPPVLKLVGAEVTSFKAHAGGSQLDVFMTLWESAGGFAGQLEYCTDLFEATSVERIVRNYRTLLDAVLETDADRVPVNRLRLMHPSERELVVKTWNATEVPYGGPARLDRLFLDQVARTPDAVAVRMGKSRWTYRQFADHALAVSAELRATGVRPGECVGIFAERSPELLAAVHGTVLAGAAFLPLDPEYPAQRLGQMLEDARARCVLAQPALADKWSDAGVPLLPVRLGSPPHGLGRDAGGRDPDETAYVIFTSGSTGRPKGVVNTHRGITNRIHWMQQAFALTPADVVLHKTPIGFDVSVWELFWPLCTGAQLEIAPPGAHRDPAALADLIRRAGVTTVHFVPSLLRTFVEHPAAASCRSLRRIVSSGEALSAALVRRCCTVLGAELDNLYGPTEAAIDVAWWRCRDDLARHPVPIGRPISNAQLYVLDEHGEPVPAGMPGELHIAGVQVARGYVNRADLTRERFVPDPFANEPGARMYRTGDRARWNWDGTLAFLGRLDHQVKIRGMRVELADIEAALEAHPDVRQSVVVPPHHGDVGLTAYVTAREGVGGTSAWTDALRAHLGARLPPYMVPRQIVLVDSLKLGANGKVDRSALPAADPAKATTDLVPAMTEVERWLRAECESLLGQRLGVAENIFDAGFTSLTAAQLITRIRRRFGADVPLVRVFEYPTISALSAHLAARDARGDDLAGAVAKARERAERRRAGRPAPRERG